MAFRGGKHCKGWDDETTNTLLVCMVTETIARMKKTNPTRGDRCMQGKEIAGPPDSQSAAGLNKCHLPISQYFTNAGRQKRSLLTTMPLFAADNSSVSWMNGMFVGNNYIHFTSKSWKFIKSLTLITKWNNNITILQDLLLWKRQMKLTFFLHK